MIVYKLIVYTYNEYVYMLDIHWCPSLASPVSKKFPKSVGRWPEMFGIVHPGDDLALYPLNRWIAEDI